MQVIRSIIVDDEEFAVIEIREQLVPYPNVEVIDTFSDGLSGLQGINEQKPDLIFVDIEMSGLNGFEMLGRLACSPVVIFCTGFSKYAIDGYAYEPTDFLLKPLKKQRFEAAMQRAFKDIERRSVGERLLRQKQQLGYLLLEFRDLHGESRKVYVWPEDILYVQPQENNANYLEYYLEDSTCYLVKKTLKKALKELENSGFFQVHRSFLVNAAKIKELYQNDILILRHPDAPRIPVSRAYRKTVKRLLQL
ncbi:MAG: response regulator transcription factor [Deltaproteobacteria bacterium]|jgi:two-component system, LytTR family, response regulator|nr:response regulator transcription factor [Deltaproteobacteria bacterium]MBT4637313.1 response regulator transcription factor [Deltaproteobacteria bacterium]MBT6504357.1 response regulator transcription factor [Deltaproteobacteria bacterium]MBT6614588.1 response regulator transcription factor [Deltaproteobacteria bacterium]MBT7154557.1 response regulator transcription factor [Deltaproteobacteria bacterium]